ncbi:hypothetical protein BCR39DRAFT_526388 [Naematelia encephala]|uniref:Pre-rRNA-processing protein n=1 Tax=Naematelia encephala TaxID=71784 RepID=A0A1Y2B9M1_9TREE|nr:hypothetical protein BCR39DRAFT_526388 [Naematelia encephala]
MPKVTKKKKEKQADFQKAKFKLGKGKKQASNATDTSFKARSVALPGQQAIDRALVENVNEPVTSSGLVLDEVLVRFRHPNAGVRKEALSGLKEILSSRPSRDVGKVLRALGGVLSDDDVSVRKALLSFLEWYLSALPASTLSPHLPLLILQASSALSHIFPEIRLDACKAVHLLLQHIPGQVVAAWPQGGTNNILEGLRLAVGIGGDKVQSGKLGASGRLTVLRTLRDFLVAALSKGDVDMFDGWIEQRHATNKGKGKERMIDREMVQLEEGWVIGVEQSLDIDQGTSWDIGRITADELDDEKRDTEVLAQLYLQLHPLLLNTFLESAPQAFGPSSSSASDDLPLDLCSTVSSITYILASNILNASNSTSEVRSSVSDLLRRMAGWFPYRSSRTRTTSSGLTPSFDISLSYASLVVLLAPRPQILVFPKAVRRDTGWRIRVRAVEDAWKVMRESVKRDKGKGRGSDSGWALGDVAGWIEDLLSPNKDALAPVLTPTAYSALLPIIFALLTQPPSSSTTELDIPSSLGQTFIQHLLNLSSTSATRALADDFLISLYAIHEQPHPRLPFYILPSSPIRTLLADWFGSLPRVLWELGTRHTAATERLLRFLLIIGQRGVGGFEKPYSLIDTSMFPQISAKLAPFFHLDHPTKGSVPGPWVKLAPELRKLGLAVGIVWREWDEGDKLGKAIDIAVTL